MEKVFSVLLILFIGCSSNPKEKTVCKCSAASGVYKTVIVTVNQKMQYSSSKYGKVAILDSTETFSFDRYPVTPDSAYFRQQFPTLHSSTFRSFLRNNKKQRSLPQKLSKGRRECNEDDPEARCILFSDVGFSIDCNQDMVSFVYMCGGDAQCGYKEFVLLEKNKERWFIQNDFVTYEI